MEPEEADVCLRCILKDAKRRGSRIFEIFDRRRRRVAFEDAAKRILRYSEGSSEGHGGRT